MGLSEVLRKFLVSESYIIEVSEEEINVNEFERFEVPIGTRVIIFSNRNGRKRLVDLGILKIIYERCNKEFVKEYLDLSRSLIEIYKKYNVYTELEYLALCGKFSDLHRDLVNVLVKLKKYILSRSKLNHDS